MADDIMKLRDRFDEARRHLSETQGALNEARKRLEELGFKTPEEAQKEIDKLEHAIEESRKEIESLHDRVKNGLDAIEEE